MAATGAGNSATSRRSGGSLSYWEVLVQQLTVEAEGESSWAPNRLDVFVRGGDNALYHKSATSR
jgi:hypothetical protein